jgi:hypothetical protein
MQKLVVVKKSVNKVKPSKEKKKNPKMVQAGHKAWATRLKNQRQRNKVKPNKPVKRTTKSKKN